MDFATLVGGAAIVNAIAMSSPVDHTHVNL